MLKRREMDWSNEWVKEYPQSLQAVWFCTANVKSSRKKRELFCVINSPHRKSHMASLQYNSLCTGYRYQQIEDQKKKKQKMYIIHTDIHNMDKNASSHSILLRYLSPFLIHFSTKPDDYFSKFTNVFILSVNLLAQGIVFCSSWSSFLSLDWWKTKINPNLNNRFHSTELPGDPLPPEEH